MAVRLVSRTSCARASPLRVASSQALRGILLASPLHAPSGGVTVPAEILDGKALAETLRAEIAAEVSTLHERTARIPGLSVVLVGNNPASETYVRNKGRAADKVGIRSETIRLPDSVSEHELLTV